MLTSMAFQRGALLDEPASDTGGMVSDANSLYSPDTRAGTLGEVIAPYHWFTNPIGSPYGNTNSIIPTKYIINRIKLGTLVFFDRRDFPQFNSTLLSKFTRLSTISRGRIHSNNSISVF